MAVLMVMEVPGGTTDQYEKVNEIMGIAGSGLAGRRGAVGRLYLRRLRRHLGAREGALHPGDHNPVVRLQPRFDDAQIADLGGCAQGAKCLIDRFAVFKQLDQIVRASEGHVVPREERFQRLLGRLL